MSHSDAHNDEAGDRARWMTFTELAAIRGTSKRAAVTLIRRHGWRRQRNNEGHVIALVPLTWATPEHASSEADDDAHSEPYSEGHSEAHATPFHAKALAALEDAIAVLREQLEASNARANKAEQASAAERQRADDLRDRLNTMQEQLSDAHAALQASASADARADRAEADRAAERGRADRAEAATTAERARADALRERIEELQRQLTARQEVVAAAEATRKAEDARRARGRWARLRAAWRGE